MKKILLTLALSLAASPLVAPQAAHAEGGPAWTCLMGFEGRAHGLQVILGKFKIAARGNLNCVSITGEEVNLPVKLDFNSKPIELRLAAGSYRVNGQSASIALFTNSPEDLLGDYVVAQAQGSILAGAGVVTAAHVGFPDVTVQLSLQFVRGFGINLGLDKMHITLDEERL